MTDMGFGCDSEMGLASASSDEEVLFETHATPAIDGKTGIAEVFNDNENEANEVTDGSPTESAEPADATGGRSATQDKAAEFAECVRLGGIAHDAEAKAETPVYEFLEVSYAYGMRYLISPEAIRAFCTDHGRSCTAATEKNPFLPVIDEATPRAVSQAVSQKACALLYAKSQGVQIGCLAEFLKENGGIVACAAKKGKKQKGPKSQSERDWVEEIESLQDGSYTIRVKKQAGQVELEFLGGRTKNSASV